MADFKTHVTVGSITGLTFALLAYVLTWSRTLYIESLAFFLTIIGSFLPDIDSNSGLPIRILFGFYALVVAGASFYFVYESNMAVYWAFIIPISAGLIVWFVIAPLFKKYTVHRGIYHSIPLLMISFFFTFLITRLFRKFSPIDSAVLGLAVCLGYLSHLILDEIYSLTLLDGKTYRNRRRKRNLRQKMNLRLFIQDRIQPKRSLGTALKFVSQSRSSTIAAYLILFILMAISAPALWRLIRFGY